MRRSAINTLSITLFSGLLLLSHNPANAYSPGNHEASIVEGAKLCLSKYGVALASNTVNSMIKGVLEPDDLAFSSLQMVKQRLEAGSYGKQRSILPIRIAAQSIHGSPNPTAPIYQNTKKDKLALSQAKRVKDDQLMPDRLNVEIYSYDTNQTVRNKMLINASQYLCVSLAHKDDDQSARKFGNFMHMIGDTFSASHVQRSAPVGNPGKCGTDMIEWHYSMDLIAWKKHRPADLKSDDWRFRCLKEHSADLINQWASSRERVRRAKGAVAKQSVASAEVKKTLQLLCSKVLREEASVLKKPAGGANRGYSSATGDDNWTLFSKNKPDLPIQPVGLTGEKEAQLFYQRVKDQLKEGGFRAEFSYPSRRHKDFCLSIMSEKPLTAPVQCPIQEINWAMQGNERVKDMWLPARDLR